STETPANRIPLSRNCFCRLIKSGISSRQGGHQVAQILSTITCPLCSDNVNESPSIFFSVKSGASGSFVVSGFVMVDVVLSVFWNWFLLLESALAQDIINSVTAKSAEINKLFKLEKLISKCDL